MEGRKGDKLPMSNEEASPKFAAVNLRMARMRKTTANFLTYLMNLDKLQMCPSNLFSKCHEALLKYALRPLFMI